MKKIKYVLASILVVALGALAVGCESKKGTTESKTETKVSTTKDGKVTGETTTTVDTKQTTTLVTPNRDGATVTKTIETTTETTK